MMLAGKAAETYFLLLIIIKSLYYYQSLISWIIFNQIHIYLIFQLLYNCIRQPRWPHLEEIWSMSLDNVWTQNDPTDCRYALAIVQHVFLKWWSWGCINARPLVWTKCVSNKPLSNIAHRSNQNIQSISISSMFILGCSGCTKIHKLLYTISSSSNCYHFGMISLTNPSLTSLLTGESILSIPFHSPKQLFHPHLLLGLPKTTIVPMFSQPPKAPLKEPTPKEAEGFPEPPALPGWSNPTSQLWEFIQLCEMNEAQLLHHSAWQPFGSRASRGSGGSHGGKGGWCFGSAIREHHHQALVDACRTKG